MDSGGKNQMKSKIAVSAILLLSVLIRLLGEIDSEPFRDREERNPQHLDQRRVRSV
jgi:hypothetical protein